MSAPDIITLEVLGIPQPQGSKTAYVRNGHATIVEAGNNTARSNHAAWRQAIATEARDRCIRWQHSQGRLWHPIDGPCQVIIDFRFPKPKSSPKKRLWPDTKPDIDKLARSVLDAITGLIITNDSRVVDLIARKCFAGDNPPGATIHVKELEP